MLIPLRVTRESETCIVCSNMKDLETVPRVSAGEIPSEMDGVSLSNSPRARCTLAPPLDQRYNSLLS
ncbi:hypothetical protein CJ030_MR8G004617 [Morella rubra]|uniref:Uncharacterized protein n=1 Tax=Morella rubra TaxID=262757 RepID=A0A6A1UQB9_9ROSI|nr:hypothetical protein CJ030_MR8G004617 [Morella rubra]